MQSIRNRIVIPFLVIIAAFIALLALTLLVYTNLINKYQQINSNIIYEQELKDGVWSLVEKCYNNFKTGDFTEYEKELANVRNIEHILDSKTNNNKDTYAAYLGVKNSLKVVVDHVNVTKQSWEVDKGLVIDQNFFKETGEKFEYVKENTTALILAETHNIAVVSKEIRTVQTILTIIMSVVTVIVIVAVIVYALNIAKIITDPIIDLSELAKKIARGDLDVNVESKLLSAKDEMGSLSNSISAMVVSLREKMGEIRSEKDRMNATIESMGDGLIVTDNKNKILLVNASGQKLLDLPKENIIGKELSDIVSVLNKDGPVPDSERPIARMHNNSQTVKVGIEDNIFYRTMKGRVFPVALIATPLLKDDMITGAVVVFKDITLEKKLDDSKTNFISISSHQLRTPLSAIKWFAEMLSDEDVGKLNEEQKGFVKTIVQSTDRMAKLINMLLQIARVEMGRVKIQPIDIDLKALTEEIFASLKNSADAQKQVMEVTTHPAKLPVIKLDREMIWQIIMNLLTNALRYSAPGSKIEVSITEKGELVEFAVKDHGIGIPEDQKAKIFEKFYRAPNAVNKVPEGSGLGLFLVKSLVEDWGGKIWFDSIEGKGTTFTFTIPVKGIKEKEGEVTLKV